MFFATKSDNNATLLNLDLFDIVIEVKPNKLILMENYPEDGDSLSDSDIDTYFIEEDFETFKKVAAKDFVFFTSQYKSGIRRNRILSVTTNSNNDIVLITDAMDGFKLSDTWEAISSQL